MHTVKTVTRQRAPEINDIYDCILNADSQKLHDDLLKVEQLETKITGELQSLKDNISRMEDELVVYNDLDQLKMDADEKKKVCNKC